MVVAKCKGVGRGVGGGRPKGATREVELMQLRMPPETAGLIRGAAGARKVPAWRVVELAIRAMEGVAETMTPSPDLTPVALELAQEAATFIDAHENRPAAVKALRRAWRQALVLARHDLDVLGPDKRESLNP